MCIIMNNASLPTSCKVARERHHYKTYEVKSSLSDSAHFEETNTISVSLCNGCTDFHTIENNVRWKFLHHLDKFIKRDIAIVIGVDGMHHGCDFPLIKTMAKPEFMSPKMVKYGTQFACKPKARGTSAGGLNHAFSSVHMYMCERYDPDCQRRVKMYCIADLWL